MKRLLLAFIFVACAVSAQAQQTTKTCVPTGQGNSCQDVNSTHPFPVTSQFSQQIAATPTITVGGYVSGNCVGGFNSVSVANTNGQTGQIDNFRILSPSGLTPTLSVFLFDSSPATSTCTDKGAFSLSAADIDRLIVDPQSATLAKTNALTPSTIGLSLSPSAPFTAGGSTSSGVKTIYYAIVSSSSFTPTTASDIHIRAGVTLN